VKRIRRIFLGGLFALLPLALTAVFAVWAATLLQDYAGPESAFGRFLISIGLNIAASQGVAYALGALVMLGAVFGLGLIVETKLGPWFYGFFDWIMLRIPLFGNVYDLSKRFVAIVEPSDRNDLKSMSPVWCFFGGDKGAAVLALMPSPEPVMVGSERYHGVLVPSAPVPFGGCLIYVPAAWIMPAEGGVERLVSVYVSMGATPPQAVRTASAATLTGPTTER
jgi:uncharacterized membrane protein